MSILPAIPRKIDPLYIAKMGSGPVRMWIQGRIHGNEPFGNDVCLELIKSLLSSDRKILEEIAFYIIPSYNPDGSERFWRGNATPTQWDDDGNPTAGVDLNRNWWRDGDDDYSELESQAFYWAWADFKPHYALDIHHQGTYFVEDENGEDTNLMTTLSIGKVYQKWENKNVPPWGSLNLRFPTLGHRSGGAGGGEIVL